MAAELRPRTAAIPEWQRRFLSSVLDKVLPKDAPPPKNKVSVLLDSPSEENAELAAPSHTGPGKKPVSFAFLPPHLVCGLESHLVFGLKQAETEKQYAPVCLDRITEIPVGTSPPAKTQGIPAYVYIQTAHNLELSAWSVVFFPG
ncbi:MAG: hypothetical protein LBT33_03090 [Spirochaetia bacterium]|jgi:hypothetical protein|nr:hypothetical protein [Spirochaetia bacterium]